MPHVLTLALVISYCAKET